MRIFAIGDLHLSGARPKAMDVFGPEWTNHRERICSNWKKEVGPDDVVLLPGDISWATRLEEARPDLDVIGELPGEKILVRGNHDYWWSAPAKVRRELPDRMHIIQNDAFRHKDVIFCGTRGWIFPTGGPFSDEDRKLFEREKIRLRLSLDQARSMRRSSDRLIVLMHYPPLYEGIPETDFVRILEEYEPDNVVFGHLHGKILSQTHLRNYRRNGIRYDLVSADYAEFAPVRIA